eukprot:1186961-Prorocentrum_minimum.AAC.4
MRSKRSILQRPYRARGAHRHAVVLEEVDAEAQHPPPDGVHGGGGRESGARPTETQRVAGH